MDNESRLLLLVAVVLIGALWWGARRRLRNQATNGGSHDDTHHHATNNGHHLTATTSGQPPSSEQKRNYANLCDTLARAVVRTDVWLVIFTGVLAFFTFKLTEIADRTDTAVHEATKAANDANKLNAVSLRPWVDFDVFDIGTGFVVSRETISFGARYSLKNTGRLPAMMINAHFEMQPLTLAPGQENEIADLVQEHQIGVCKKTEFKVGNTIFPNQSITEPYAVIVEPGRRLFDSIANLGQPIFIVLVTGCAGYQLTLTGTYGHTSASILVGRPGDIPPPLVFPLNGTIDAGQLVRMRVPAELAD
jgi:hypothetical protein